MFQKIQSAARSGFESVHYQGRIWSRFEGGVGICLTL